MVLLFNHRTLLHRALLIPIYKSFIRPYLNNRDMMYDQTLNMLFQQERETIHDIAASAITKNWIWRLFKNNIGIVNYAASRKY